MTNDELDKYLDSIDERLDAFDKLPVGFADRATMAMLAGMQVRLLAEIAKRLPESPK